MERLFFPVMKQHYVTSLKETGGADFAYIIGDDECRFRVNLFYQRGKLSLVARRVSSNIPSFEKLGLVIPDHDKIRKEGEPTVFEKLCMLDQGLVLLAGVTGSGKSTTIAAMLNFINKREPLNIVTLEDPIEYVFTDDKCIIHQREVYLDVKDWPTGLKHAVRQDPDIILVGEMRTGKPLKQPSMPLKQGTWCLGRSTLLPAPRPWAVFLICSPPTCIMPFARPSPSI